MNDEKEFAVSSNGDQWLLTKDPATEQVIVVHRGNPSSGGHETRLPAEVFLNQRPRGPEQEALLAVLSEKDGQAPNPECLTSKTHSLNLAEEYMRLGGRRRANVDDNIISTRRWEDEPAEAEAFWAENIAPLDAGQRQQVVLHLPSTSDT